MQRNYRLASIFWLIIGIFVAISAYRLGLSRYGQPGPGLIFFLASFVLIISSVVDLGGIFFRKSQQGSREFIWAGTRWPRALLVLGALFAYVFLLNILGFILSTFVLMAFLFAVVEPRSWWTTILISLITIMAAYGIFKFWLQVPFPEGLLGF